MTTTISSVSAVTTTSAQLNMSDTGANGTIDVQVSTRPDFQFCVCPIFSAARASNIQFGGLNQRTTYWVRTRNRSSAGVVDDWGNTEIFRTADGLAQAVAPAAVMIEPAALVTPLTAAQIITTGDVAGFPVSNLFRDAPVAWRGTPNSNGDYAIYLRMAGQPFDTVALLNHNIPEGVTVTVTGGSTQALSDSGGDFTFATPARASLNLPGRPGYHTLARLPVVRNSNWVRIVISAPACTGNILQIGSLIIGLNRVSKNHAVEKTESPAPLTTSDRKRSGIVDRVKGLPMRKVDFELQMLTEAQYETIYGDLWRYEGEPVLVIPNTKAGGFLHDRILYGELTGGRIVNATSPRYTRSFTVNSII
jgi:hypothetical protein